MDSWVGQEFSWPLILYRELNSISAFNLKWLQYPLAGLPVSTGSLKIKIESLNRAHSVSYILWCSHATTRSAFLCSRLLTLSSPRKVKLLVTKGIWTCPSLSLECFSQIFSMGSYFSTFWYQISIKSLCLIPFIVVMDIILFIYYFPETFLKRKNFCCILQYPHK